jgi:hypothetical protein
MQFEKELSILIRFHKVDMMFKVLIIVISNIIYL